MKLIINASMEVPAVALAAAAAMPGSPLGNGH
jgi:hypothetical protein